MAVGLERAHAECLGQGQGLLVVIFGQRALGRIVTRRYVAEEAQGICLVTAFLVLMGMRKHILGEGTAPARGDRPAAVPLLSGDDRGPESISFPWRCSVPSPV